ncbi:CocE/NonD family hydrolase [Teichococcus cervicalis]|uniref:Hydrolase CocE/NonD family protein n=1 Tax=Pseudoroseomonas cervicalis ATCC 49957 TaxID=525371 RepID=D5RT39_9PROT|nr:CocE/NonD family hydrolase [Pseudoroseomonas cervicalis]EFH09527.1 hydrolase CocE/NonD family protein [Pseudoroseomonas cervicalis ATCC 49957]
MSDSDHGSAAWHVTPSAYAAAREAAHAMPAAPESRYLAMRDGCRIAIDVWRPEGATGPVPAILILTPYYRRFAVAEGSEADAIPNAGKFVRHLVPRGYAVVVVDVRGTGASFGTRDSFRSPKEREDSREIADWIVAQPWSDGRIGATGISYPGAASDFLASTGHPAVKAIAPLFAVWDTYADNYYPGGILLKQLAKSYDDLMVAMDHDRRDLLRNYVYYANPDLRGPHPVDEDADGSLLAAALREHLGNFRQPDFMGEFRFREEPLPYDPSFSSASFSPYSVSEGIRPDVAVLAVSGWMDGAGYANGAIARYLTLRGNKVHLLLGPWDHGARCNVSPWRREQASEFALLGALLRFFDHYLLGRDTGLEAEQPVHYFSLHAEEWRGAASWPPVESVQRLHLGEGTLDEAPGAAEQEKIRADFAWGSGSGTRYERIAGINSTTYYADWPQREAQLPGWSSAPLARDMELTGHGLADLWLSADTPDAALFVYLSEVEADGTVRYVTEGLLRALHRKESPAPAQYRTTWPFRSFRREDAAPLVPGQVERIRIPLLPISWVFRAGSRIRLSIAGMDADHCVQVPHGRPPELRLLRGGDRGSALELPLRPAR